MKRQSQSTATDAARCCEELARAREQLEQAVAREAGDTPADWLHAVQAAARALYTALEQHRHYAEEPAGTLAEVVTRKPGLMSQRGRLEHEHADMLHRACEIDDEIERQLGFQDLDVDLVRLEAGVLHDILLLHLMRTGALLYESYARVEGGQGG